MVPQGVTRIEGDSPDVRGQFAAVQATTRNAKIAIYGVLRYDSALQETLIEPEFTIVSSSHFNDAEDITGSYAFGSSIQVNSPEHNEELDARITALSYVMVGLSNYMTLHYQQALDAYQRALAVPGWGDAGREVVYALRATPI